MIEIREPGFRVDLPEAWTRAETDEPGSFAYRDAGSTATLTVMLLAVRPAYSIADKSRLHSDYMQHRAKFERGQLPSLEESEPTSQQLEGLIDGSWSAVDVVSGRRRLHRVMLAGSILADFCLEDLAQDEATFVDGAKRILSSAAVVVEVDGEPGA